MWNLRRSTTAALAPIIATAQVAGLYGFFAIYPTAGIDPASATPEAVSQSNEVVRHAVAWLATYLMGIVAGLVLSGFAAKGFKLWCFAVLCILTPLLAFPVVFLVLL